MLPKFRSDVIRGGICGNELRFETGRREKMSFDRTSAIKFYTVESESFEPRFILIVNSIMYFPRVPASSNLSNVKSRLVPRANDLGETIRGRSKEKERKIKKNIHFRILFSDETYFLDLPVNIELLFPCTSLYEIK